MKTDFFSKDKSICDQGIPTSSFAAPMQQRRIRSHLSSLSGHRAPKRRIFASNILKKLRRSA